MVEMELAQYSYLLLAMVEEMTIIATLTVTQIVFLQLLWALWINWETILIILKSALLN